jgi:methyltransferase (TIGR00027 family)
VRYRLVAEAARVGVCRTGLTRLIDARWPGVRATVIARTRLIDEMIAAVVDRTPQVVILGAGFDTRAWRLGCLRDVDVFEVDHPATQEHKRRVLERRGFDRDKVRLIPTDFNLRELDAAMSEAGFEAARPTLFLWEGTTNYLTADAVDVTLRWCSRAAVDSQLIFTYINDDVLRDPSKYVGAERVFSTVRRANEPMTFGLAPERLATYLSDRGLRLVDDVGAAAFRERCYGSSATTIHGHEFYRVAHACVDASTDRSSAWSSMTWSASGSPGSPASSFEPR